MLTAQEAAQVTGYGSVARFRNAVKRRRMPQPADPETRPQLWSRAEIEAKLNPSQNKAHDDTAAIDRELGI